MTRYIRFADLKKKGIVNIRCTLRRWIMNEGFPTPTYLGPNSAAFQEDQVEAWIKSRPQRAPQSVQRSA